MPLDDALAACADGRIANAMTLIALQWLALNRRTLEARWQPA
jgi:ADP-ribose pyrophosphatase